MIGDALASITTLLPATWTLTTQTEVQTADRCFDAIVEIPGPAGAYAPAP